jgi:nitrate reductase alpha subunit
MHQTDTLFHKQKVYMGFMFGVEADNHMINTTPKETLVKITKAENGGLRGVGRWPYGTGGTSPGAEDAAMQKYMSGKLTEVDRG